MHTIVTVGEDGLATPQEGTRLVIRRGSQVLYATNDEPAMTMTGDVLSVEIVAAQASVGVVPHPRTRAINEEFGWVDAQEVTFD